MNILLTLTAVATIFVLGFCQSANSEMLLAAAGDNESVEKKLHEANKKFTFNGKPIPPECIQKFNVSLSDSGPPIVRAVDVESCVSSNESGINYKISDEGYIGYEYGNPEEKSYFGYKYVGKASGGLHVLDTVYSGGGTMVAKTIFLTRFSIDKYKSFDDQGRISIEERLIMTCIGQIVRGDRDIGKIELKNNEIILGESQYRTKLEVIKLD